MRMCKVLFTNVTKHVTEETYSSGHHHDEQFMLYLTQDFISLGDVNVVNFDSFEMNSNY